MIRTATSLIILAMLFPACSGQSPDPDTAQPQVSSAAPAEGEGEGSAEEGIPTRPDPLPAPDCGDGADCLGKGLKHMESHAPGAMAQALANLEKACSEGHAGGCMQAGLVYWLWDQPGDMELAVARLQTSCDLGLAEGCRKAGVMYEQGWATGKPDVDKGLALYEKGCEGGDQVSCERGIEIRTLLDAPVGLHPDLLDSPEQNEE